MPRPRRPRPTRRGDELRGFWPGLQLAVVLGVLAGTITAGVFVGWVALTRAAGLFVAGEQVDVAQVAGWWGVLWVALSVGLLAGLWLGYRAWHAVYPAARRRAVARERRHAVAAAEALIEGARATPARDDR